LKWSPIPSVLDRNYVLGTQFLFENQWFGDIFYSKTEGSMHALRRQHFIHLLWPTYFSPKPNGSVSLSDQTYSDGYDRNEL